MLAMVMVCTVANAQDSKGLKVDQANAGEAPAGKTYALVVGISRYQYPDCYPTLHYADVDAREFYKYLTAKTGGNVDPANVDTLFNERATKEEFLSRFNSTMIRLQKNDNFYIYFSGHGDAISSDLAYLLTYNAPPGKDKSGYFTTGGVVDVHTLKSLIKMITSPEGKNANVMLITDACRSNELPPGKEAGRKTFYEEMYTKNSGEIQLVSCLANQQSFEDAKWGKGRGLFSWHLVNGLWGMADNKPMDGVVTLKELTTYVADKVSDDAYDAVTKQYKQTPDYCCKDKDASVMAKVDAPTRDNLAMQLKLGNTNTAANSYALATGKGVNIGQEIKEAGYEQLYDKFIMAINENRLIAPKDNNAMSYLDELLKTNLKPELKSDLKFRLGNSLMGDVTKVMNEYLYAATNNNNYTYDYFMNGALKLRAFQKIGDTLYYSPRDVKVNLLFLEGHAPWQSSSTYVLKESLRKVDSAIALKPQASFLYNLKGLMHMQLQQYKEAEATLRKGVALAPNWLYPYHNLAMTLVESDQYDSALKYYFKALALDTNYQTTYGGLANLYSRQGKYDSALYYNAIGLKKYATDPHLWHHRGYYYYYMKDYPQALKCFHTARKLDSALYDVYAGIIQAHIDNGAGSDSISKYSAMMVQSAPDDAAMYISLGNILQKYDGDSLALEMYAKAVELDSTNTSAWISAAKSYEKLGQQKNSENCYYMAMSIDTAASNENIYHELGIHYYRISENSKALDAIAKAIKMNPDNYRFYNNYAYIALVAGDTVDAEQHYRAGIKKNARNDEAYYRLALIMVQKNKKAEALKMLEQATKYGSYKREDIAAEPAFAALKDDKTFKSILETLKKSN